MQTISTVIVSKLIKVLINYWDCTQTNYSLGILCINHYLVVFISPLSILSYLNLLKPTGHVMHQQFNIQQLYALSTLYLCVLYLSENKQRLVPLTA